MIPSPPQPPRSRAAVAGLCTLLTLAAAAALAALPPTPAHAFAVGHRQLTFVDPARGNRSIQTEVYYPADAAGDNVPVAAGGGAFPVLSFGHGYLMPWSAYAYLWAGLVPEGYIVALPRTEGNLFPSHSEFGRDLAFVIAALRKEGVTATSPFAGRVDSAAAVLGHSMGGGASFLAAAGDPTITALANLAAAETNPSAIAAASTIRVPALVFSGSLDCVTPPADHQVPMYGALASACKTLVSITGGTHCQFAESNTNCNLGQVGCPAPGLTRDAQQAAVLRFLVPWLAYALRKDADAWAAFQALRASDAGITSQQACGTVDAGAAPAARETFLLACAPNPAPGATRVRFRLAQACTTRIDVIDAAGRLVRTLHDGEAAAGEHAIAWDGRTSAGGTAAAGAYRVRLVAGGRVESVPLIVFR